MKKIIISLLSLFVIIALVGCKEKQVVNPAPAPSPTPEPALDISGGIMVSAAGSLTDVGEELKAAFLEKYPHVTIDFNYASSGALAQQIENGAPTDLFLSAASKDMNTLEEKQLINKDTRVNFAKNEVVIVAAKDSSVEISSLEELANLDFDYYAQGDFEAVPVGRYAKQALEGAGVWEGLTDKRVLATDVNQILSYVTAGNAELGFVFKTDAIRSNDVKIAYILDATSHDPVVYPGAVVTSSINAPLAQAFLDFIVSSEGLAILEASGFASAN